MFYTHNEDEFFRAMEYAGENKRLPNPKEWKHDYFRLPEELKWNSLEDFDEITPEHTTKH